MSTQVIDLGFRPRQWQDKVLRMLRRFSILLIHRRAGKTVLAILKLIDAALRFKDHRGSFAYIAPELKQAKAAAWNYLKDYATKVPGTDVNESETWVQFPNKARIRLFGADNPNNLRGLYFDGVVIDEVAQAKPELWDSVLIPALADRRGWAIFIGTPGGVDLLSRLYHGAQDKPDWFRVLLTYHDTNAVDLSEINAAKEKMSPKAFRREWLCDLSASRDDVLLTMDQVVEAMNRDCPEADYIWAERRLGVDVARMGDDKSVVFKRQGLVAFKPIVYVDKRSTEVSGSVQNIALNWHADRIFVDGTGGYGAGVIDNLYANSYSAIDVQFGGAADDSRFLNKRAEIWWRMAEWVKRGGCLPKDEDLLAELTSVTYWHNEAGKLRLEAKEDVKERLGFSVDRADALACTFATPDRPGRMNTPLGYKSFPSKAIPDGKPAWEYNPLETD